jgi:glycosyltransferase involved in cell wall biosynthesis
MSINGAERRSTMRCLWLTLADPEPRHNGQYLYSGGLIDALAGAGVELVVLGLARDGGGERCERRDAVEWHLAPHRPLPRWASLGSSLPHIAHRCHTVEMRRTLDTLLQRHWDGIVFDSISAAWALRPVLANYQNGDARPRLVYVSHNHEESLRRQIAGNQGNPVKSHLMRLEAAKVATLERRLVDGVDLVTAITPQDGELYRASRPDKQVISITPGYGGRAIPRREITPDMPRRAVIVGSFDWVAKRMNLAEFVAVADPLFASAAAELHVVGSGEPAFLEQMRKAARATVYTGTVDSIEEHLDQARIAVVPERSGGGFKLKVLEYVFNRLPILALEGSIAGMPLQHNESVILCRDHQALAQGVMSAMDDLDLLNRMQNSAYKACCNHFDWASRGEILAAAMSAP